MDALVGTLFGQMVREQRLGLFFEVTYSGMKIFRYRISDRCIFLPEFRPRISCVVGHSHLTSSVREAPTQS